MVGRVIDTVGHHYWSLACNLSEPVILQLLSVGCMKKVRVEVSTMQDPGFGGTTQMPHIWAFGNRLWSYLRSARL